MAKRGAENQKTREGGDSDEEQIEDPGQRATPLAPVEGRVIRGMPKRKGLGGAAPSPAPPAPTPAASSTPFSGFSFGSSAPAPSNPFVFGGGSSASTPVQPAPPTPTLAAAPSNPFSGFSFAKPAAPPAPVPTPSAEAAKPAAPTFGFGAKPAQPSAPAAASSSPFAGFSFGTPAASAPKPAENTTPAPAPAASKPFSFGTSPAPSTSTPVAAPVAASVTPSNAPTAQPTPTPAASSSSSNGPVPSQPTPPPEGEVSYYTSLRGLNTSILSFLTSTIEQDQFTDLSVVLPSLVKQYETHLDEAATKAGWTPEGKKAAPSVNGESSKAVNGTSAPTTFKMPSAPSSEGFALPKAPTANPTSSTPSFGGFTPAPSAAPPSGFTFGGAKPATTPAPIPAKTETPKKPSAEVTKLVEDVISGKADDEKKEAPKPFSFGSSSTSTSTPDSKKTSSLFSFAPSGPLHPPTPESKTFSPSSSLENATPAKLGKFGPGGSQPQLAFGGAKSSPGGQATPGTPAANKPSSFSFGFGSSSASTAPAPASASGGASFSFGSSSGTSATSTSGSSAPTFSFGSSASTAPKAPATTTTPAFSFGSSSAPAAPSSTPSFSFGAKPTTTSTAAPSSGFSFAPYTPKPAEGAGEEGNGDLPPENAEPSKNLAETTGAGEENEDTIVEQRGKLNKLDNGEFKLQGLGQFKLKRSKDGKKRRLLMRTDGSGNVILNMSVNSSFNPTVDGAHVKFLGFDGDGKPVPYALRVKSAEVAKKIQEELQKEVDAIKSE